MAGERRQHVAIDVVSLSSSLLNMMEGPNLNMPPRCCIFLTPKILRRHNEKAYAPDAFSIGPFHRTDQSLKATEKVKVKYLQALIRRSSSPNPEQKLDEIIKGIGEIEREARECYAPQAFLPNENEFVKILLLRHDLCLLENQIPWLVLERLFVMTSARLGVGGTFGLQPIPSARILEEGGIKFQRVKSSSILDIQLRNDHVLEIPPLLIQETTEVVFRNLISYEQCLPGCRPVITSYAILFNNLIKTAKDVNILIENGIIHNWLNLEDATQFFNKLYVDTYVKGYFYFQLSQEINLHCRNPWPKLRTFLVRNYLYTPMGISSQIAAVVLNLCGIIQAVCSIVKK
ncbi:hypothetical protein F2P56_000950 [Juglans regia]|uniref:Uncharacterized protein LOC108987971 n=2 Tax=Juglans regia TaxID=51240 RepID=A0A2I4EB27_JUGRE|nr:uncharacterized protein LOC108987971 [Juglans regia]KAF5480184.1 hypothetical protein F2P56_000950 [Juglans regia]